MSNIDETPKDAERAADVWSCSGSAYAPHLAQDASFPNYIAFTTAQTCGGDFFVQRVCVDLQKRDYYGNYSTISHCVFLDDHRSDRDEDRDGVVLGGGARNLQIAWQGDAREPFVGTSEGWSASRTLCKVMVPEAGFSGPVPE